jgi:hypothetical protein
MRSVLPEQALLAAYARTGAYTDCYAIEAEGTVHLADYVAAFYSTPVFKLERWLISRALGRRSTDADALALARGTSNTFSAWQVEGRAADQLLVASGRTRSWFMVVPQPDRAATRLLFGSAVVPRSGGGLGLSFTALLGVHKLYSRVLLGAAARRLAAHSFPR